MNATAFAIRLATKDARERTGDRFISTRVEGGRIQVVRVVPLGYGMPEVVEVSEWLTPEEAIAFLDGMQPESGDEQGQA